MQQGRKTKQYAFTLIELLTVIAIIGILAGMILAGVAKAKERARITRAKAEIVAIETAWHEYLREYTLWPNSPQVDIGSDGSGGALSVAAYVSGTVTSLLAGVNVDGQNPKLITFMEFRKDFLDPWKRPYKYILDRDMNDSIELPWGEVVKRQVVVWSTGYDGMDGVEAERVDDVRSWR
jgi:prepilin-type N-terminal cleavage/methylation domain-containing protein